MTATPGDSGPLLPGQIPGEIRADLPAEDADAFAEALALILGVPKGERPRSAPPMVLQALADIAWGEMVARRMVLGMSHDVARAQAAADAETWMIALRLPDLAGG